MSEYIYLLVDDMYGSGVSVCAYSSEEKADEAFAEALRDRWDEDTADDEERTLEECIEDASFHHEDSRLYVVMLGIDDGGEESLW